MTDSFCKTLAFVLCNDKPSELIALAKEWGIGIPVNSLGYTDYCGLKQRLARFALDMDSPPGAQTWQDSGGSEWMIWSY